MKTIIYILIGLILSSILIPSLPISGKKPGSLVTIQCTGQNVNLSDLNESAEIFKNRLKDFSPEKFNLTVIPEKNQIQVLFTKKWDLNTAIHLLMQKGEIGFYETFNQESLLELLNGDNHLFSLLNEVVENKKIAEIGCTSELEKVNNYIHTLGLSHHCKFVWSQFFSKKDACLYALKLLGAKGSILNGTDIESINNIEENSTGNYSIEIAFNKSATKIWSGATKRNLNSTIAIVVDNNVISAPVLNSAIENGKCSISGDFTKAETQYFIALVKNGELPLNFELVK